MLLRISLALTALLMIAFLATRLEVHPEVTYFLPPGEAASMQAMVRALANSDLTRTMVVTVGARDESRARAVARELAAELASDPAVSWVRAGVDHNQARGLYELYFQQRFHFLSDQPDHPERGVVALTSPERLRESAIRIKHQLALPTGSLADALAQRDPLGVFSEIVVRAQGMDPGVRVEAGQFMAGNGREAVVLLETRASPFDTSAQAPFLRRLHERFSVLAARAPDQDLVLESSGINRFAVRAEQQIRRDALTITVVSLAGVTTLFLAFFRSLAVAALALVPSLYGILVATCVGSLLFDGLHAVTLAFGASLVGAAIDYSVHLMSHHSHAPPGTSALAVIPRLRTPLLLGAGTTVAGFVGLSLTDFPGFREIGVFSVIGIVGALVVTVVALPRLLGTARAIPPLSERSARSLGHWVGALRSKRRLLAAVTVIALAVAAAGLPDLRWTDDVRGLFRRDPDLIAEDLRVRARVSRFDTSRFVLVTGSNEATALARNDALSERLSRAIADGDLEGMRSLHSLLWSPELQIRNRELLRADTGLRDRFERAFAEEGFRPDTFAGFFSDLSHDGPPPLTLAALRESPVAPLVNALAVDVGGETVLLTYLRGVRSEAAIEAAIEGVPGARLFDQTALVNDIFAGVRQATLRQLAVGSVLIAMVLVAHYRRWRPALAAFLPPVTASLLVLAVLAFTGVEANLLHAVSLLLVMGMGVDYGVFIVDSGANAETLGVTMLSLLLCCLTTVFGFGALALSTHPALRALGITTGLGVALSFLLAPVAWAALGDD